MCMYFECVWFVQYMCGTLLPTNMYISSMCFNTHVAVVRNLTAHVGTVTESHGSKSSHWKSYCMLVKDKFLWRVYLQNLTTILYAYGSTIIADKEISIICYICLWVRVGKKYDESHLLWGLLPFYWSELAIGQRQSDRQTHSHKHVIVVFIPFNQHSSFYTIQNYTKAIEQRIRGFHCFEPSRYFNKKHSDNPSFPS